MNSISIGEPVALVTFFLSCLSARAIDITHAEFKAENLTCERSRLIYLSRKTYNKPVPCIDWPHLLVVDVGLSPLRFFRFFPLKGSYITPQ